MFFHVENVLRIYYYKKQVLTSVFKRLSVNTTKYQRFLCLFLIIRILLKNRIHFYFPIFHFYFNQNWTWHSNLGLKSFEFICHEKNRWNSNYFLNIWDQYFGKKLQLGLVGSNIFNKLNKRGSGPNNKGVLQQEFRKLTNRGNAYLAMESIHRIFIGPFVQNIKL